MKTLLVTNDVSLTGAPILLLDLAKKFDNVDFWSIFDIPPTCKSLQSEFERIGNVQYFHGRKPSDDIVTKAKQNYDLIICNTIETAEVAYRLNAYLWYHEMFINNADLLNKVKIISLSNKHTKFLKSLGVNSVIKSYNGTITYNPFKKVYNDDVIEILLVGSFIPRKNQLAAIDIVRPFDNVFLTMVGSFINYETGNDEYYQLVKRYAKEQNVKCSFIDTQPHEIILQMIKTCDILLCPSIHDTYPRCVIEALEFGRVVIMTNQTCIDFDDLLVKPYSSMCVSVDKMQAGLMRLIQSKLYKRIEKIKSHQ